MNKNTVSVFGFFRVPYSGVGKFIDMTSSYRARDVRPTRINNGLSDEFTGISRRETVTTVKENPVTILSVVAG